jgi:hypothetical protein
VRSRIGQLPGVCRARISGFDSRQIGGVITLVPCLASTDIRLVVEVKGRGVVKLPLLI